jgi:hypothetical protein
VTAWVLLACGLLAGIVVLVSFRRERGAGPTDPVGLRTVASFRAAALARREAAEDENPQTWGVALLREVIARIGPPFEVVTEYSPSYGYAGVLRANGKKFTLSVGFVDDAEGWLLFVNGGRERSPVPDLDESRELLRRLLRALPDIDRLSDVRWTDRTSFERNSPTWESTPFG